MKKQWYLTLMTGCMMLLGACSSNGVDEDNTKPSEPTFPAVTTTTIASNGISTFSITPNLDWTLTIDDSENKNIRQWFWFLDNGERAYTLSGKASTQPITIQVQTVEREEFDETPTCYILMTMGGKTQRIASIVREAAHREFAIYTSKLDTDGFFETSGNIPPFTYAYNEQPETANDPAKSFALLAIGGMADNCQHRLKVTANFDWVFEAPEWLEISISKTFDAEGNKSETGFIKELTLNGLPTNEVAALKGAAAPILFYPTGKKESECFTYYITYPDFSNVFEVSRVTMGGTLKFNGNNQYYHTTMGEFIDGPAIGSVTTVAGVQYYKAALTGSAYSTDAADTDWIEFEIDAWDTTSNLALQSQNFSIGTKENNDKFREGVIIALPASVKVSSTADLFSGNQVKAEYEQYVLTYLTQEVLPKTGLEGNIQDFPEFTELMQQGGAMLEMANADERMMLSELVDFSNDFTSVYKLTSKNDDWGKYMGYRFFVDPTVATCDIFCEDSWIVQNGKPTNEVVFDGDAWPTSGWLAVTSVKLGGISYSLIHMNPHYNDYLEDSRSDGIVVFKDASGNTTAIIWCVYDKSAVVGDDDGTFKLHISTLSPHTGKPYLEELSENDVDYDKSYTDIRQYRLTYQGGRNDLIWDQIFLDTSNFICEVENTESNPAFRQKIQSYFEGIVYLVLLFYEEDPATGDYKDLREVFGTDTYRTVFLYYDESHTTVVGRMVLEVPIPAKSAE